jgi:hypothetical protein
MEKFAMSRICWLLTIVTTLVACNSRQEPVSEATTDASGAVELEFVRTLNEQIQFRLSNQTSQAISFRVGEQTPEGVHPVDVQFKCKRAGSDQWDEGPRPMADRNLIDLVVAPGSEENLIVLHEPGSTGSYVDGACRVDLRLQGGPVIESDEFLP